MLTCRPEQHPDGAPEFKEQKGSFIMEHVDGCITHFSYNAEALRFKTISEFVHCLSRGGEIVIEWNEKEYGIFYDHDTDSYYIGYDKESNVYNDTPDALLEYSVDGVRLRDVITEVTVVDRWL